MHFQTSRVLPRTPPPTTAKSSQVQETVALAQSLKSPWRLQGQHLQGSQASFPDSRLRSLT